MIKITKGQRIAYLRKQNKESQSELGKAIHVSTSTIGMWEKDHRTIKDDDLVALAKHFNVSTDYLLGIHNNKQNSINSSIDLQDAIDNNEIRTWQGRPISNEMMGMLKRMFGSNKSSDKK